MCGKTEKRNLGKARRLRGRKGGKEEGKVSLRRLISKFDPDKEFYRSVQVTDKMMFLLKATVH